VGGFRAEFVSTHAVILSGGGANGAFEVGVMKALFNGRCPATSGQPLDAHIFTGTSVGAFNASVMASHPDKTSAESVGSLEDIWLDQVADGPGQGGNGVFRFRGGVSHFLDLGSLLRSPLAPVATLAQDGAYLTRDLFRRGVNLLESDGSLEHRALEFLNLSSFVSMDPLRELIRRTVSLEGLQASEKHLAIVATNWVTGEARVFRKDDMVDEIGYDAILASTAIPGFFPPVDIDTHEHVDGGLVMNTPLLPAIDAGADVVHMIYLDPDPANIPLKRLDNTLDTLDRMMTIQFAKSVNADLEKAEQINLGLEALEDADRHSSDVHLAAFVQTAHRMRQRLAKGDGYRKLTVHRYHPSEDLGGVLGLLKFHRGRVEDLIELGAACAEHHDCEESGCF